MSKFARYFKNIAAQFRAFSRKYDASMPGELGSGAGKGGGPFGKIEAAREEEHFHKLQQRLLVAFKIKLGEENCLRNKSIDEHKCAIEENDKLTNEIDRKLIDCDNMIRLCRQYLPSYHH